MWLLGLSNFFFLIFPLAFMEIPIRLQSNLLSWIKSVKNKTQFQTSLSHKDISIIMKTSMASSLLN